MARVKVFKLEREELQSFWCALENMGCKIPKKQKEACRSLQIFRDVDGEIQITCHYDYYLSGKVKSPSV